VVVCCDIVMCRSESYRIVWHRIASYLEWKHWNGNIVLEASIDLDADAIDRDAHQIVIISNLPGRLDELATIGEEEFHLLR